MKSIAAREDQTILEASNVRIDAPGGRPLFQDLQIRMSRERVAIIGRNGVGKTCLLEVLAGLREPEAGVVRRRASTRLVAQVLGAQADKLSAGQQRKLHLRDAFEAEPELLMLDEPTQDLDMDGVEWLLQRLSSWRGGLLVVSHDRRLLRCFREFVIVAESGCQSFSGSMADLEDFMARDSDEQQRRYLRSLSVLAERERHNDTVCRRRRRKKNVGRLRELARATPRSRLNEKRGYAQVSQARAAKIREDRINTVRSWAKESRRALSVRLDLELPSPVLPLDDGTDNIVLEGAGAHAMGRPLFENLSLRVRRHRIAVMGPNGAGKTTLLRVMLGQLAPRTGFVRARHERIGVIAQGASDWMLEESLRAELDRLTDASADRITSTLLAHRFPLALAERPMWSLSPGERVRAALVCLFERSPPVELLVLDEPADGLDFVGEGALRRVLASWPGGLVVVSHDPTFVDDVRVEMVCRFRGLAGLVVSERRD